MLDLSFVIAILGAFSAFLFTVSCIPARSPLARTLEELESRSTTSKTTESGGRMERFVTRVLPQEQRGKLGQMLLEAGWYTVTPAQIVFRIAAAALIAVIAILLVARYVHFPLLVVILLMVGLFCAITYAPMSFLHRAMERRKDQVQITLPDFLDMVAATVQAGLSVNAALAYAVDTAPGALGDEIKEALAEVRLGRARADALKAAAERLNQQEFTTTVAAIVQAERLGSNIGKILSELAEDVRTHRILIVEEHAAKLPVKMVFPMGFFLLPALFVIIFGSLIINYLAHQGT
ncbi:MAG TPA: type II secretion system F family protein [Candidatus Baltobacteraceae bacterium]|jgi:tight adherence protein C|nr:type II secretion system F family protein [Candidatus Baltobacteraceae bacterium]